MLGNKRVAAYALFSLAGLVLSYLLPSFPWLVMVAVAPLLAIYREVKDHEQPFPSFGIPVVICLALAYGLISGILQAKLSLPLSLNYGIVMSIAFFAYWLTDTYAPNRLGFFTIIIYYTGLEYLSLLFVPDYAHYFLGNTIRSFPALQQWNTGTGLSGVSAWILAVNIGVYHVLFRDRAIFRGILRWRSLILVTALAAVPLLISTTLYSDMDPLSASDVSRAFSSREGYLAPASAGEVFGRTCAWVSVLIVIYGLVKQKVNK